MVVQTSRDELDSFTGYPVFLTSDHAYIHQGKGFSLCGETTSVAAAGTYAITTGAEFPIWTNLTAESSDAWTRETDAITYTLNGSAGGNCLVAFYVPASILTAGRDWIHLGASAGDAGNIVSVLYILDGARYKQASVPTAIA